MLNKTKFALTAALFTAVAAPAFADSNYFGLSQVIAPTSDLTIENVTSTMDGTVVAYDYHGGEFGDVLGSTEVSAGANVNVQVNLGQTADDDMMLVLYHGGMGEPADAAAWVEIRVEDDM